MEAPGQLPSLPSPKSGAAYYCPIGDRTHDLPHTVASNMVNVSHALTHSATAAVA